MSTVPANAWPTGAPRLQQHTAHKDAALRMTLTFMFLGIAAPVWIWLLLPQTREFDTSTALALIVTEFTALRLTALAFRATPRLLAITFYVFLYVWGGLAAFAQNYSGTFPWGIRHAPEHATWGMWQIVLTLLAYEAGQIFAARQRTARFAGTEFEISQRNVLWICVAALPLLVLGMLILGGPAILFTSRAAYNWAVASGTDSTMESLVGSALFRAPAFTAFALVVIVLRRHWRTMGTRRRRTFVLLLLYSGAIAFVGNYPLSLPRQWLGTIMLTPLFALLPWRRWQVAALGVGMVALILFVFPYADAFRRQASVNNQAVEQALNASVIQNILNKGDFDVYQQSLNAIAVTEREGFAYGLNFAGAAAFWFPRAMWPGKPLGTGVTVAYKVGYPWHQTNLSAPLWMEAYWAFGWLGIALIIGAYSWLCGGLDRAYIAARAAGSPNALVLLAVPFFAAYQFILMRGDILNGTAQAAPVIILFLLSGRLRLAPRETAQ